MNILILGAKGSLGGQFKEIFPEGLAWDKEDCDITNERDLQDKILALKQKPEVIINCAAYNDVDGSELNQDLAVKLNIEAPFNLASIAKNLNAVFVHFSTNYVFDGEKGEYAEDDLLNPISVYGESKRQGEEKVKSVGGKFYIVRTSVLFGKKGSSTQSKRSFVDIMLDLEQSANEIKAVKDEVMSVTYIPDLASAVKNLLESRPAFGVYHITNQGSASWFDFAKEIFRIKNSHAVVIPVLSSDFPRKAARPKKAVLLNTKLPKLRPWQEALAEFLTTN